MASAAGSLSAIESLPFEIIEEITSHLLSKEIAKLSACSRLLHATSESLFFCAPTSQCRCLRSDVMHWAVRNGVCSLVKRLVTLHKMRIDKAAVMPGNFTFCHSCGCSFWALKCCIDRGDAAMLELLISLGAKLGEHKDIDKILKPLCKPQNEALLKIFVASTLATPWRLDRCLLTVLRGQVAAERAVELLLDHGADPYRLQGVKNSPCPLAVAIAFDFGAFDRMLAAGADIRGVWGPNRASHGHNDYSVRNVAFMNHPIFAAARNMPRLGTIVVQKCIDTGASVSQCVKVEVKAGTGPLSELYDCITPIYTYLANVKTWSVYQLLRPSDGVRFWLKAGVEIRDGRPVHQSECTCGKKKRDYTSLIHLLITRWPVAMLADDEFFATVMLLAKSGISPEHANKIRIMWKHKDDRRRRILPEGIVKERFDHLLKDFLLPE